MKKIFRYENEMEDAHELEDPFYVRPMTAEWSLFFNGNAAARTCLALQAHDYQALFSIVSGIPTQKFKGTLLWTPCKIFAIVGYWIVIAGL